MPRILFIASHRPDRSPAQRFRFEQYLSCLKENGIDYDFSYLITEADDKIFYAPGNLVNKLLVFFKSALRRFRDVINADKYDIIFVQREAFMTGSSFFEKRFGKSKARLVFDFDDAIWYHDVSDANKKFGWLKDPSKTGRIIGLSDLVFAGNQYLADYAARFNNKVIIVPTTIDTEEYKPVRNVKRSDKVVIGGKCGLLVQPIMLMIPLKEFVIVCKMLTFKLVIPFSNFLSIVFIYCAALLNNLGQLYYIRTNLQN